MHHDDEIAEAMFALLRARAEHATICPSEVARALEPLRWRPLMPRIREVARSLATAGRVELRQRGKVVDPSSDVRGPLRIALGRGAWPLTAPRPADPGSGARGRRASRCETDSTRRIRGGGG